MRIIGCVVLLVAFALVMFDVTIGSGERQAIWLGKTDRAVVDSGLHWDHPVVKVCIEMDRNLSGVHSSMVLPVLAMLVGAIILDWSGRRRRRKQDQQGSQPPAAV